jgi:hypothetical protein
MGKRSRAAILLAVILSLLGGSAVLSACGGGGTKTEESTRVPEAMALLERPDLSQLTEAERDLVKSALREALGRARKVRVLSTLDEQDLVFGADGRVAMMRSFATQKGPAPGPGTPEASESETIRVYDGPPAHFCDGREDPGMVMVIEYTSTSGQWQVSARAIQPDQVPFEVLLSGIDLSVAKDAGFSDEGGHRLRGFSAPFAQPGDPEATVTLWVDLQSGLIRRLETTLPGAAGSSYPFALDYDLPVNIQVPSEPAAPDCVPVEQSG